MPKLLSQVISATAGLWLATLYVPGVVIKNWPDSNLFDFSLKAQWQVVLALGITVGLFNYFLKPALKTLYLPLEIITITLSVILIDVALLWLLDVMFDELIIPVYLPLLYTALIIWGLNIIINFLFGRK